MKKNVKTVKIIIPNKNILERINTTPAFQKLSRLELIVGENIEKVNNFQYSEQKRMFPIIGVTVEEIIQK
jgi:hypothetical protein